MTRNSGGARADRKRGRAARKRVQTEVEVCSDEDASKTQSPSVDTNSAVNSTQASPSSITMETENAEVHASASESSGEKELDTTTSDGDGLRELPEEAFQASNLQEFSQIVRPWLTKAVAGLKGRQLESAVSERWNQVLAQRQQSGTSTPDSTVSGRPVRASRERTLRNISTAFMETDFGGGGGGGRKRGRDDDTTGSGVEKKLKRESRNKARSVAEYSLKIQFRRGAKRGRDSDSEASALESEDGGSDFDNLDSPASTGSAKRKATPKSKGKSKLSALKASSNSSSKAGSEDDRRSSEDDEEEESDDHNEYCKVCREGGDLLCCDSCPCTYHITCLNPPLKTIPEEDWICPRCLAEPLPAKVERILTWRWAEPQGKASSEGKDDIEEGQSSAMAGKEPESKPTRQFLVKFRSKSYHSCQWVSELQLDVHDLHIFRAYTRRMNMKVPPAPADPDDVCKGETLQAWLYNCGIPLEWLVAQRVVATKKNKKGEELFLVKWRDMPYEQCTWENESVTENMPELIQKFSDLRMLMDPGYKKKDKKKPVKATLSKNKSVKLCTTKYESQPDFIQATGGKLHPYQLEGLNWLRFSWAQDTNTILADEMGLGKTIQTISFLYSLVKEGHCNGPFLISAPLSTLINWEREFEFWAPDLYVVTYAGGQESRCVLREYEFSFEEDAIRSGKRAFRVKSGASVKFHVLLTSYEMVAIDSTVLQSIDWEVLVIDEAHRLKSNQSRFFRIMSQYNINYTLLLTGTPLQNNLEELFHLLNFLSPDEFNNSRQFLDEFEDISKEDQVTKLHDLLGPHLLRRLKADVLQNMPSKSELIVRVDMAPMQKKVYRNILTKNYEALNSRGGRSQVSLLNIMMDLKKCCNHPYLFPGPQEEAPRLANGAFEGRALTEACGKMLLLEQMLERLKKNGHRVLLFSQMTRALDLLEDFMEYKGYVYERIDGGVAGTERQLAIDRFNAPGSSGFVFLLSTRAGGLGINLATADTVIIYDSDWNPHNDIQAFSRAHRIGQENKVMIYRFVTRASVEERITEVAKRKMMLTHLVVRPGMGSSRTAAFSKSELDNILRFGTQQLFEDDCVEKTDGSKTDEGGKDMGRIVYDDEMLDKLLDRRQEGIVTDDKDLLSEYFSSFKVASFSLKEDQGPPDQVEVLKEESEPVDSNYWEKLLRHHYEQQLEEENAQLMGMGKGKRQRKAVNYLDSGLPEAKDSLREDPDASFSENEEESSADDLAGDEPVVRKRGRRLRNAMVDPANAPLPSFMVRINGVLEVLGFSPRHRRAFHNSVMRFGLPPPESFQWLSKDLKKAKPISHLQAYLSLFLRHLCEPDLATPTFSDGVPREGLNRDQVLSRIGTMRLIRQKVHAYKNVNGTVSKRPPTAVSTAVSFVNSGSKSAPSSNREGEADKKIGKELTSSNEEGEADKKIGKELLPSNGEGEADKKNGKELTSSNEEGEADKKIDKELLPSNGGEADKKIGKEPLSSNGEGEADKKIGKEPASSDGEGEDDKKIGKGPTQNESDSKEEQISTEGDNVDKSKTADGDEKLAAESNATDEDKPALVESKPLAVENEPAAVESKPAFVENEPAAAESKPTSVDNEPAAVEGKPAMAKQKAMEAESKPVAVVEEPFMFNIADGGFTELHVLWAREKEPRPTEFPADMPELVQQHWTRRHDYWLLAAIVCHGYARWPDILSSPDYLLLTEALEGTAYENKVRFLNKRLKLLEQALIVEEQLRKAHAIPLVQDAKHPVMALNYRFAELECLVESNQHLVAPALMHNKAANRVLCRVLRQMDDLLNDMRIELSRLPAHVASLPPVTTRLGIAEEKIIKQALAQCHTATALNSTASTPLIRPLPERAQQMQVQPLGQLKGQQMEQQIQTKEQQRQQQQQQQQLQQQQQQQLQQQQQQLQQQQLQQQQLQQQQRQPDHQVQLVTSRVPPALTSGGSLRPGTSTVKEPLTMVNSPRSSSPVGRQPFVPVSVPTAAVVKGFVPTSRIPVRPPVVAAVPIAAVVPGTANTVTAGPSLPITAVYSTQPLSVTTHYPVGATKTMPPLQPARRTFGTPPPAPLSQHAKLATAPSSTSPRHLQPNSDGALHHDSPKLSSPSVNSVGNPPDGKAPYSQNRDVIVID